MNLVPHEAPPVDPKEELLEAQAWDFDTVHDFYEAMKEAYESIEQTQADGSIEG